MAFTGIGVSQSYLTAHKNLRVYLILPSIEPKIKFWPNNRLSLKEMDSFDETATTYENFGAIFPMPGGRKPSPTGRRDASPTG